MAPSLRSRLLTVAALVSVAVTSGGAAYADQVANNLDASVDAAAEVMPLNVGGADGNTDLYLVPKGGDGKPGCNLTGSTTATFSVASSNTGVATVSPATVTFDSCGTTATLTVTPHALGAATITLTQTANNSGGSFDVGPASFTVNVAPPANTAPTVDVTGIGQTSYELGVDTLPAPGCAASDTEDGPSSPAPTVTNSLNGFGLGPVEVTCSYTDAGGLTATSSQSYVVVDTIAPVIVLDSVTPAANADGWNKSPVTAAWVCSDAGSGVQVTEVTATTEGEGSALELTGTCADNAGHYASDTVDGLRVDLTDPVITIGRSPAANAAGWNNVDVTVAWACADTLSGTTDSGGSTVLGEGADQSVSATCTDLAGNSATDEVPDVDVDQTAPEVSWTGPIADGSSYYFGTVPASPTCSATDLLSGLDGACAVGGHATTVGTHTVTARASDVAGNTSQLSSSYTVMAWTLNGYDKPVDGVGVWNTVKNGSTVPLKFEAFMGSTEITDVTTLGAEFTIKGVACPGAGAVTDDVELTTTGGTTFRYDWSGGQFVQNWQTPKKAGACYQVVTTTADGSSLSALFKLK